VIGRTPVEEPPVPLSRSGPGGFVLF